jgi:hypothetical protein
MTTPEKRLAAAVIIAAASSIATVTTLAADQPAVPYPTGFRSWQVVRSTVVGPEHPSFPTRGGIHHYYANDKAVEGYRTGVFPNGSMIVDEGVFTKDGEGKAKGLVFETERRAIDVMVKNNDLYKETSGWGFEQFKGDERTGVLTDSRRKQCHDCHSTQKNSVFTALRK